MSYIEPWRTSRATSRLPGRARWRPGRLAARGPSPLIVDKASVLSCTRSASIRRRRQPAVNVRCQPCLTVESIRVCVRWERMQSASVCYIPPTPVSWPSASRSYTTDHCLDSPTTCSNTRVRQRTWIACVLCSCQSMPVLCLCVRVNKILFYLFNVVYSRNNMLHTAKFVIFVLCDFPR